ncbi:hypothetical protein QTN25_004219 [Entamoeba marina]
MSYRRRSCEMSIPLPLKLFSYDSSQSSSSCSSSVSPADFVIPPRNTNPVLNDQQFTQYLYSPNVHDNVFDDYNQGSSSTFFYFKKMKNTTNCHLFSFGGSSFLASILLAMANLREFLTFCKTLTFIPFVEV